MATNKTTRQMSGGAISNAINEELQNKKILNKKRKILSITKRQVNRILKKKLIQRKVRKTFYLNSDHKKERKRFCENIIKNKIREKDIFFTDETRIDTAPPKSDFIRITKETNEEIKNGDE